MLQGVIGLLLVGLGVALMFALKPREVFPVRFRAVSALDILVPLVILALFIVGGLLLSRSLVWAPFSSTLSPQTVPSSLKSAAQ